MHRMLAIPYEEFERFESHTSVMTSIVLAFLPLSHVHAIGHTNFHCLLHKCLQDFLLSCFAKYKRILAQTCRASQILFHRQKLLPPCSTHIALQLETKATPTDSVSGMLSASLGRAVRSASSIASPKLASGVKMSAVIATPGRSGLAAVSLHVVLSMFSTDPLI